jgi:CRP-like cAMP-binding protein
MRRREGGYDRAVPPLIDDLARVTLFSGLNKRQLRQLAKHVKEREFRPGVTVVKEGTMSGVGFFVVADGEAIVSVEGAEVARVGPGDYFGELALITEDVRTATVTASTRLHCHVIQFWDFRRFAMDNPDVAWKLLQHLAALLVADRQRRAQVTLWAAA